MRHLMIVLMAGSCLSCSGEAPKEKSKTTVHDIGWTALISDGVVAKSYAGYRIRLRFDPNEYRVEGNEIHVRANDNGAPPILIFRGADTLPRMPYPKIMIVGDCQPLVQDGHRRKHNADWYIVVTNCVVTVR